MRRAIRFVLAGVLLAPSVAGAMAGDGALLTNAVSATYHGVAGVGVQYTVSYAVSTTVLISCPVVGVVKSVVSPSLTSATTPNLYVAPGVPYATDPGVYYQNVGGTVTFSVCTFNNSLQASAFGLTMRDQLPANTVWADVYGTWGATFNQERYSTDGTSYNALGAGSPANGTGVPIWFYWEIDALGPGASACATYAVRIL